MVKLGFIVEGATEKILLEKSDFFSHLQSLDIGYIPEIIDAKGNGNLMPHNILQHTAILNDKGATHIIILTDLDDDKCITLTKQRIEPLPEHIVVIAVKAIESWLLSDSVAMQQFLKDDKFTCAHPEAIRNPFEEIKELRKRKTGKGIGTKVMLANTMTSRCSFSLVRAAAHPDCTSAAYLLKKIAEFAVMQDPIME